MVCTSYPYFGRGSFKPVIDRSFSLNEIVEAYKYVETEQKTGNVIIKISDLK